MPGGPDMIRTRWIRSWMFRIRQTSIQTRQCVGRGILLIAEPTGMRQPTKDAYGGGVHHANCLNPSSTSRIKSGRGVIIIAHPNLLCAPHKQRGELPWIDNPRWTLTLTCVPFDENNVGQRFERPYSSGRYSAARHRHYPRSNAP